MSAVGVWESGLENSEVVLVVLVRFDFEHAGVVGLAPDFEVETAACQNDFVLGGDAGLFAQILRDQKLALIVHRGLAAEHVEAGQLFRLLGGGKVAVLDDLHPGVEGLLGENLDDRHLVGLGEEKAENLTVGRAPTRLDGHPKLRVHLVGEISPVALTAGAQFGVTIALVAPNTPEYTEGIKSFLSLLN